MRKSLRLGLWAFSWFYVLTNILMIFVNRIIAALMVLVPFVIIAVTILLFLTYKLVVDIN